MTGGESPPSAASLRAAFEAAEAYTVGLEDEVMLLDPDTFELVPRATRALERMDGDNRFKLELPASQLEITTPVTQRAGEAARMLLEARVELVQRCNGIARLAAAAVHPSSSGVGELNRIAQYRQTLEQYPKIARRELVCAFQVHVALGDAGRALAVYNAARCYLPLLAALAANGPFYEGQDTGLASIRPKLCELLPRQGIPPRIESWEQFAEDLRWGEVSGAFHPGAWWWELRPHRRYGTLEFRVPDAQTTVTAAAALTAVIQALVAWLGERHDAGGPLPDAPDWRIAQNRWSACRDGPRGAMADLATGRPRPTEQLLGELLEELSPAAAGLASSSELGWAHSLVAHGGAAAQRQAAAEVGIGGLARWLGERFLEPLPG